MLAPCLKLLAATLVRAVLVLGDEWEMLPGVDNKPSNDLRGCCTYGLNVSTLKGLCTADKWCAGFSSYFGTLKLNVSNLAKQSNTDLYVRIPQPPPFPPLPNAQFWPMPHTVSSGTSTTSFAETFTMTATTDFPLLEQTLSRYHSLLFRKRSKTRVQEQSAVLGGLDVTVTSSSTTLTENMDESYTLDVPTQGRAKLSAPCIWGVMRGLETFIQLFDASGIAAGCPVSIQVSTPEQQLA